MSMAYVLGAKPTIEILCGGTGGSFIRDSEIEIRRTGTYPGRCEQRIGAVQSRNAEGLGLRTRFQSDSYHPAAAPAIAEEQLHAGTEQTVLKMSTLSVPGQGQVLAEEIAELRRVLHRYRHV